VAEAFAVADGEEITAADLPRRLTHAVETAGRTLRAPETIVLHEFLSEIERELIERALRTAKGNKAKAARLLGLTRPRLYRRMVQLGLEEQPAIDAIAPRAARRSRAGRRSNTVSEKRPILPAVPEGTDGVSKTQVDDEAEFIENIPFEEQPE
jgi:DNA-binding protein Fis